MNRPNRIAGNTTNLKNEYSDFDRGFKRKSDRLQDAQTQNYFRRYFAEHCPKTWQNYR